MATLMKPTPADKRELNLNPKIKLPKERYTLRIKDEEFQMSKAGNPMLVLSFEFMAPDVFTHWDGSKVNIAGVELNKKMYMTLRVTDDKTKEVDPVATQKAFDRYCDLLGRLGKEIPAEGIDVENPPKLLKGTIIDAICDAEEFAQRKDPTPEQKAQGKLGDIIKDANGKEIKAYFTNVVDILGLGDASVAANKPMWS